MIVTDYNKMTIFEIEKIYKKMGVYFIIASGKIVGIEIDNQKKN